MSVFAVYNIKGGVGKTSGAVNLAWTSAAEGHKTLLWDLDSQGAASFALKTQGGLEHRVEKFLSGKKSWHQEVRPTAFANLFLIPADLTLRNWDLLLDEEKKSKKILADWLQPLSEEFQVIFLDCPPGLTLLSENLFRAADHLLLPVVPSPLSFRTLMQLGKHFADEGRNPEMIRQYISMAEELFKLPGTLKTVVPLLAEIERMSTTGVPSASVVSSKSKEVFKQLFRELQALN